MMRVCFVIVPLLLAHACMCQANRRLNSRNMQWSDSGDVVRFPEGPHAPSAGTAREERKLIFINNIAYDLSEDEMDTYLQNGVLPKMGNAKRKPSLDSLSAVMNSPAEAPALQELQEEEEEVEMVETKPVNHQKPEIAEPVVNTKVKTSRFVADASKQHLIQKVDKEELENLRKSATTTTTTATPSPDQRVVTDSPTEASTIRYEYTQVSVLSFLWNEFKNIGDLLGREMLGSISGTLYYLWETVVRYVSDRSRRALLRDASNEF